ncbi:MULTISPECIES: DUF4340 domain-containing protein [Paraliobacillus]|uniref:DUF4340 domain-containing protein n=1 Tax=Paraliobacillus TaxID=200903 RepID=UPI000DD450B9|nr:MULTISPECIES: DUF4340 domain-containing protein [Paraliobacillus]
MKRKYLLIISIVIIGLAVLLFFLTDQEKVANGIKQSPEILITESEKVDQVTIQMDNTVTLEKVEEETWTIKDSQQAADQEKIQSALTTLFSLEGEKVDVKKKDVGLDFPQIKLKVGYSDKDTEETWTIGDLNAAGSAYYVENQNAGTIYLVASTLIETLPLQKQGYTDNQIITITSETVNKMTIDNGAETIELTNDAPYPEEESRANITGWYVHVPYSGYYNAAYSKMSDMIYAIDQFEMTELVSTNPTDLSEYGLDEADFTITLGSAEKTEKIIIGDPAAGGNYYAMLDGKSTVFTINNQLLDLYSYQAFDLLDGYVKIIALDVMNQLKIESAEISAAIMMEHTTEINAEGEEEIASTFRLDDKILDEDTFRDAYKFVAGLKVDKVAKDDVTYQDPEIELTYVINIENDQQKEVNVAFVPYDETHYAVFVDEVVDFLVLKDDVSQMLEEMKKITK